MQGTKLTGRDTLLSYSKRDILNLKYFHVAVLYYCTPHTNLWIYCIKINNIFKSLLQYGLILHVTILPETTTKISWFFQAEGCRMDSHHFMTNQWYWSKLTRLNLKENSQESIEYLSDRQFDFKKKPIAFYFYPFIMCSVIKMTYLKGKEIGLNVRKVYRRGHGNRYNDLCIRIFARWGAMSLFPSC